MSSSVHNLSHSYLLNLFFPAFLFYKTTDRERSMSETCSNSVCDISLVPSGASPHPAVLLTHPFLWAPSHPKWSCSMGAISSHTERKKKGHMLHYFWVNFWPNIYRGGGKMAVDGKTQQVRRDCIFYDEGYAAGEQGRCVRIIAAWQHRAKSPDKA